MTILLTYRTTDPSGHFTGTGADLSASQIDNNFFALQAAVNPLLAQNPGVGIASIQMVSGSNTQFTFTLTNATVLGPFTLPTAALNWRGIWAALTAYAVDDVFQINGSIYIVLVAHTSATTFSAGANDGAGHNYYGLMLSEPSNALPAGGATGAALIKNSAADFDTVWTTPTFTGSANIAVAGAWPAPAFAFTGLLPVANGGTGTGTPGLVAGTNVTISGTWPNQTINASGGTTLPNGAQPNDILKWIVGSSTYSATVAAPATGSFPSANYTLSSYDADTLIQPGTNIAITLPSDTTKTVEIDTEAYILGSPAGHGAVTFVADTGVTLTVPVGYNAAAEDPGATVIAKKQASNNWSLFGALQRATPTNAAATGTISVDPTTGDVQNMTVTGALTVNAALVRNRRLTFVFTASGTTAYTVTFGANFKANGTVSTGTVSGATIVVDFVSNGSQYVEVTRTGPY